MEEYISLHKLLKAEKKWEIFELIKFYTPGERAAGLTNLFETVCAFDDDESAKNIFSYILRAVDDCVLLPLVKNEGGKHYLLDTDEIQRAKIKTRGERVARTMKLFSRIGKDVASAQHKDPILLGTKSLMLTEIAQWWRDTPDEERADQLFDFLLNIPTAFPQEREMLEEVFKNATDSHFRVSRLTHHILRLAPRCERTHYLTKDNILRILANARNRNRGNADIANELRVLQHLEGCSDGAYEYVGNVARQISEFDKEAKELAKILDSERFKGFPVLPLFSFSYPEGPAYLLVALTEKTQFRVNLSNIPPEEHKRFERACLIVKEWAQKHPHLSVKVAMYFKRDSPDAKPLLFRQDHF